MKKTLLTCFLLTAVILFSTKGYAQQNNTISVIYGTGSNGLSPGGIGAAGYASKGFTMFGLNYMRHFNQLFSIETGIEYTNGNLLLDYIDPPNPNFTPQKTNIKILSVPVYGNITFLKYAFVNAGFSLDIETDPAAQRITPTESGIGLFLGAGGKYTFRNITLFANPFLQGQGVIPFKSNGGRALVDAGFKFGLGYSF